MKKLTRHYKKLKITYFYTSVLAIIVSAFFLPYLMKLESTGNNIFTVFVNGIEVGVVGEENEIDAHLRKARAEVAARSEELVLIDAQIVTQGREVYFGKVNTQEEIEANMVQALQQSIRQTLQRSYTVKINEFTVNLASSQDVLALLQASMDKYDSEKEYEAVLALDPTRELNVLTAIAQKRDEKAKEEPVFLTGGLEALFEDYSEAELPVESRDFDDFELGLKELAFSDTVEVVEAYLKESELTPLADAIELVTKDQEKNKIYEVVPGDTLSGIAVENDLTIEKLVAMNEGLESENSIIRVGDELIVTVPEPELSVSRTEELYYEEDYEAEVQYIPNDDWYTTEQVTRQEPSAGHRKVVAQVSFRNNAEVARDILKEEVTYQAVPKIVERGTKIPPTYIKPISGGRLSSGFGRRNAPTRGASTNHKGTDWAVPIGTAVMASNTGVVTKAGWGSGYGYVVYIRHADGRETRYAHLSKVLVSAGQSVTQGQKIALSGNTGRSTGPHLHFEILINGSQVNALNYLN